MQNSSVKQSIKVILGVCLVCSFLVSTAAVLLNSIQKENQRLEKIKNILVAADLYSEGIDVGKVYRQFIEPSMIELSSGERVGEERFNDALNIDHYDIKAFAEDPDYGEKVLPAVDIAKIKRRPKYMVVYFVKTGGQVDKIVLSIYGKGLWSTLYGFLALDRDLQTIAGITFYQHGETPGLGGEVDNPDWKNSWKGKQAFDNNGNVVIEVVRGMVDPASADASHQTDGLSGATLTTRGVEKLVKYWLGKNGYGPFLEKLRQEWSPVPAWKSDWE